MKRILMLGLVLALLGAMVLSTAAFAGGNGEPSNGPGEPGGYSYGPFGPGDGDCDCPCGDCDCDCPCDGDGPIQDRVRDRVSQA